MTFQVTDFDSAVWRKVETRLNQRLVALRKQNDRLTMGEVETAVIRGRIAEVKALLELPEQSRNPDEATVGVALPGPGESQ